MEVKRVEAIFEDIANSIDFIETTAHNGLRSKIIEKIKKLKEEIKKFRKELGKLGIEIRPIEEWED